MLDGEGICELAVHRAREFYTNWPLAYTSTREFKTYPAAPGAWERPEDLLVVMEVRMGTTIGLGKEKARTRRAQF